ncbi:MAG: TonB-dependent receptor plug domain-containing protein [Saprospirales bacterium]|nr:TonB-dependent receptor plug domain-containing protein [Saprospirales bacterium]
MFQSRLFQIGGAGRVFLFLLFSFLTASFPLHAQMQMSVSGLVRDAETQETLLGVNVTVKGQTSGTVSDLDGRYSVQSGANDVLIFSYVGYETLEVPVDARSTVDVLLSVDRVNLREITVTALGISREKKSLGYAVQEVGGDALDKARETNVVSSLAGKVAGVTIVNNPSGIGSSARVSIRGERSLNINNNQPLFVVDGVPISNQFVGSSGKSNQDVDYGNGAGLINPDDIETITVLKGANAAALYGSRANNGVILITTKTGKGTKGLGFPLTQPFLLKLRSACRNTKTFMARA